MMMASILNVCSCESQFQDKIECLKAKKKNLNFQVKDNKVIFALQYHGGQETHLNFQIQSNNNN